MRDQYLGYARVSRRGERDDDRFRSPDLQADAIRAWAQRERVTVQLLAPEIDVSGSKARRPILDAAIARIEAGEAAGLIVAKLDRLARMTPRDRIDLFERVEAAGGRILSASEQIDPSTPEGRFARDVFLGVARMEWERKRDGYEVAKANAISEGIPIGRVPIGYRQRDDRRLEPDPVWGPVVADLFARRAAGEGLTALAKWATSRGLPRTGDRYAKVGGAGGPWSRRTIEELLARRIYLGELEHGEHLNPAAHDQLTDPATWEAAQRKRAPLAAPRSTTERTWLLTGIARCHSCGFSLQPNTRREDQRRYRCRPDRDHPCSTPVSVSADDLERLVEAAFWDEVEGLGTVQEAPDDVTRVLADLEAVERARHAAYLTARDDHDIDDYGEHKITLRRLRVGWEESRDELGAARADAAQLRDLPNVNHLGWVWDDLPVAERREYLADVFPTVGIERRLLHGGRRRRWITVVHFYPIGCGVVPCQPLPGYREPAATTAVL